MKPVVLVTGAGGFIGSYVIRVLLSHGYGVRVATTRPYFNFPEIPTFRVSSIGPHTDWSGALVEVDVVIHLAAQVHRNSHYHGCHDDAHWIVNFEGTKNLAQQCASAGVRQFIFMSTVKVHGEFTVENRAFSASSPPSPKDSYAKSKWNAELVLRDIESVSNMHVTVIRPPLVYGPGVGANFAALVRMVRSGIPLPLGSVTSNRRSFVSLDNLTDFIRTCIDNSRAFGESFLISDGEDLSTRELINRIAVNNKYEVRLFPVPVDVLRFMAILTGQSRKLDRLTQSLRVDIGYSQTKLDWTPLISVDRALQHLGEA